MSVTTIASLCLMSVVCCQVEVFATGWSLIQSPTECRVSECDREASKNEETLAK
jgi:hypothetical protein